MKTNPLTWTFLLLLTVALQLPAQPSDANRKFYEDTKAEAEKGDAKAQFFVGLGYTTGMGFYTTGMGVERDKVESVKWYRKAADQNFAPAQYFLGDCYAEGVGVAKDEVEAVKWFRKAAEQNFAPAQYELGACYDGGTGVEKNAVEAVRLYHKAAEQNYVKAEFNLGNSLLHGLGVSKNQVEAAQWFRKGADQGHAASQFGLGNLFFDGEGVPKDTTQSAHWWRKASEQGFAAAQRELGIAYSRGDGVPQSYSEAYKWFNLASAQGYEAAKHDRDLLARRMTADQIAEARRESAAFVPRKETPGTASDNFTSTENPRASGSGFFITDDGCLISHYHVVKGAAKVRLLTGAGLIDATVVKVDAANDLALLKANAEGRMKNAETFRPLPIAASRTVKLGGTVATVGFPDIGLQGFAPKLAKGEIASLAGAADDPRYFQISLPVQPGNSGGALVDARGNVVGIVAAKLDASAALAATGSLPENVNYAVKSSLLLSFLESVPDVAAKLKEPNTKDESFEDMVKSAQDAAVLVLVY